MSTYQLLSRRFYVGLEVGLQGVTRPKGKEKKTIISIGQ